MPGGTGMKYDHSFSTKNDGWLVCSRHSLHESRQSKRALLARSTFFTPASCCSGSKRKLFGPTPSSQSLLEAGQRARLLAHVVLGVAAVRAEREQLHQLARVVLVRRVLRVLRPREPQQHRRVARDAHQQVAERAQRVLAEHVVLVDHQPLRRRRRRWTSQTSRATRASCARSAAGWCAPCGRATRGGRGPTRRRAPAGGRRSSLGGGPPRRSFWRPGERLRPRPRRPFFASFSASPGRGPKPGAPQQALGLLGPEAAPVDRHRGPAGGGAGACCAAASVRPALPAARPGCVLRHCGPPDPCSCPPERAIGTPFGVTADRRMF